MFRFLTRTPRRVSSSVRPVRTVRLGLEALETRYCPSAALSIAVSYGAQNNVTLSGDLTGTQTVSGQSIQLGGEVNGTATTDANGHYSITLAASGVGTVGARWTNGMDQATASTTLSVMAPNIDTFSAVEAPGDIWTFSGHVTDPSPNGLTIDFGGLNSLMGKTATVDANGNFTYTIQLNGTSTDNGWACAETTDWYGQASNYADVNVTQPG